MKVKMMVTKIQSEDQIIIFLKNYLKRTGKSQEWLANKLGFHVSTINSWLCKRTRMRLDEFIQICNILGFEVYYGKKEEKTDVSKK